MKTYMAEMSASSEKLTLFYTFTEGGSESEETTFEQELTSEQWDALKKGSLGSDGFTIDGKELTATDQDGEFHFGTWKKKEES